ncbi:MAG: bifunctional DNA primase/polymerase [Nitrospirae bacterium]|nr:bifunctional DNA primase/polymerase [Nitrospirota bacterium]
MNKHLESALRYSIECGFSVIPCNREKKPLLKRDEESGTGGWKEFQRRIAGEEEIRQWWQRWPNANVAITTGRLSNLCVIDLDAPELARPVLDELIPDSIDYPIVNTPSGGQHWYFRFPATMPLGNNAKIIPGADFRGEGGYVLAPPGVFNGKPYTWLIGIDEAAIPELPAAYIEYVLTHSIKDLAGAGIYSNYMHARAREHVYADQYADQNQKTGLRQNCDIGYDNLRRDASKGDVYDTENDSENPGVGVIGHSDYASPPKVRQECDKSATKCDEMRQSATNYVPFAVGNRDNDLFHIANQLFKSRTDQIFVEEVIKRLALTCNFSQNEAREKVNSAIQRSSIRDLNLNQEVRQWVECST